MVPQFYTKKFKSFGQKQGVTAIFPIQTQIIIRKNRRHDFIFAQNDLKFFV